MRLAGQLRGDDDGAGSALGYAAAALGVFGLFWLTGFFYTTNTAIKTAPKILPFL
jgi:hypothetical protein